MAVCIIIQVAAGLFAFNYEPKPQDVIKEYNVTVEPRANGTLDIYYNFLWHAVDTTEELSWVDIGMANFEYTVDEAVPLSELIQAAEPEKYLRTVDTMFRNYPEAKLTANQEKRCRNGNSFSVPMADGTYRAYGKDGEFLMLAKVDGRIMSTIKSFFDVG